MANFKTAKIARSGIMELKLESQHLILLRSLSDSEEESVVSLLASDAYMKFCPEARM